MTVSRIGKESKNSKSWWKGLRNLWKEHKRRRNDKRMRNDFIQSVGTKPTRMVFNKDRKYWELFWEEPNTVYYLHIKVGLSLVQILEKERVNTIWIQFNHPASAIDTLYPWHLDSSDAVIELIHGCREAIHIMKYGG